MVAKGNNDGIIVGIVNQGVGVITDVKSDCAEVGLFGFVAVILRAYSLGAGTCTGIEAVSNGLNSLREPRVQTGKRTMVYVCASLSFVGGLLLP